MQQMEILLIFNEILIFVGCNAASLCGVVFFYVYKLKRK